MTIRPIIKPTSAIGKPHPVLRHMLPALRGWLESPRHIHDTSGFCEFLGGPLDPIVRKFVGALLKEAVVQGVIAQHGRWADPKRPWLGGPLFTLNEPEPTIKSEH